MNRKISTSTIIFVVCSMSLMMCRRPKFDLTNMINEYETKGLQVFMHSKSGSIEAGVDYLPAPYNEAYTLNLNNDSLRVLILAPAIDQKQLRVLPIAFLEITVENKRIPYILSIPVEPKMRSINPVDFDDFMTKYYSIKWIIETYLSNYKGIGKVKDFSWKTGEVANQHIIEFLQQE